MQARPVDPLPSLDAVVDSVLGASRALVGVAARSLAAAEDQVTLPQYRALVVLVARGPQRVLDLAEALDVNQSTATRMCDRLVRKGLVERERPDDDRRTVIVTITDSGRELVGMVTRRRRAQISAILRRLDPHARVNLVASLRDFSEAAGEAPEQAWSLGWGQ
jgi:DNA-binding MarR family transcriptional regulator